MTPRALLLFGGLALIVAAAVVSLSTGNWWILGAVVLLHAMASAVVLLPVFRVLNQGEKADPVTEARLAEEGKVSDEGEQPSF
jgi:membrane protein implicated in regulation of membrane protease activity